MSALYEDLRLANQFCFSLNLANQLVTGLYRTRLEKLGLTFPQYLVLLVMWENHPLTTPMGDLERSLELESSTLSPVSKRLEAAGLLQRGRDPADERRVILALTPDGLAMREDALAVRRSVVDLLPLADTELVALRSTLQALSRDLGRLPSDRTPDKAEPAGAGRRRGG